MTLSTPITEEEAYDRQEAYIETHFGEEAKNKANYGWFVDMVDQVVATKVYGFGVVTTSLTTGITEFEEY